MTHFRDLTTDGERVSFVVEHDTSSGDAHEVWFRAGGEELELTGDALVAASLLPSMARGEAIEVPRPVSPTFASTLERIQSVFAAWYDDLAPVEVKAPVAARAQREPARTAAFFTGGVDSFHAVLTNREIVDALVFTVGFDVPREALPDLREQVEDRLGAAAAELDLPLIVVETNLHDYSDAVGSPWGTHYHGAALATVAHVLGAGFDRFLVGSTHAYRDQFAWGSHPLTDPLWSGDQVALEHVGAEADRVDKIKAISASATALAHLRVCYENRDGGYNCGTCRKCLRTMVALELAGALGRARTLPDELDLDVVRAMPIGDVNSLARHAELVEHLRRQGGHAELLDACEENYRRADPTAMRWGTGWTAAIPEVFGVSET